MSLTPLSTDAYPAPTAVPAGVLAADQLAFNGPCLLFGWAAAETTGAAPASLNLRDGGDTNSTKIAPINLLASESTRDWLGTPGLWCRQGVFADITAGSVDLVLDLTRL